jgi:hypothetical protein
MQKYKGTRQDQLALAGRSTIRAELFLLLLKGGIGNKSEGAFIFYF